MLEVEDLRAGYGNLEVLRGIGLSVPRGRTVALLGGNGAGKTTTMKAIAGVIPATGGQIRFDGTDITRERTHQIVRRGLALVPQGRELFPEMTVRENLELGALSVGAPAAEIGRRMERVFEQFPRINERAGQRAATLSGGEQQMLATGRALMSEPRLLLLDEPTTGLAPIIVGELTRIIRSLAEAGQTILLVEQNVRMALSVADHVYVIRNGAIVMEAAAADITDGEEMFRAYLG